MVVEQGGFFLERFFVWTQVKPCNTPRKTKASHLNMELLIENQLFEKSLGFI
jgi:hypothetical protein